VGLILKGTFLFLVIQKVEWKGKIGVNYNLLPGLIDLSVLAVRSSDVRVTNLPSTYCLVAQNSLHQRC
jgi:hypothetical protein